MTTTILIIAVFLFLIFLASRSNEPNNEACDIPDRKPPHRNTWEKNHFINKHLHRNDEKHARHKRNQTPW